MYRVIKKLDDNKSEILYNTSDLNDAKEQLAHILLNSSENNTKIKLNYIIETTDTSDINSMYQVKSTYISQPMSRGEAFKYRIKCIKEDQYKRDDILSAKYEIVKL